MTDTHNKLVGFTQGMENYPEHDLFSLEPFLKVKSCSLVDYFKLFSKSPDFVFKGTKSAFEYLMGRIKLTPKIMEELQRSFFTKFQQDLVIPTLYRSFLENDANWMLGAWQDSTPPWILCSIFKTMLHRGIFPKDNKILRIIAISNPGFLVECFHAFQQHDIIKEFVSYLQFVIPIFDNVMDSFLATETPPGYLFQNVSMDKHLSRIKDPHVAESAMKVWLEQSNHDPACEWNKATLNGCIIVTIKYPELLFTWLKRYHELNKEWLMEGCIDCEKREDWGKGLAIAIPIAIKEMTNQQLTVLVSQLWGYRSFSLSKCLGKEIVSNIEDRSTVTNKSVQGISKAKFIDCIDWAHKGIWMIENIITLDTFYPVVCHLFRPGIIIPNTIKETVLPMLLIWWLDYMKELKSRQPAGFFSSRVFKCIAGLLKKDPDFQDCIFHNVLRILSHYHQESVVLTFCNKWISKRPFVEDDHKIISNVLKAECLDQAAKQNVIRLLKAHRNTATWYLDNRFVDDLNQSLDEKEQISLQLGIPNRKRKLADRFQSIEGSVRNCIKRTKGSAQGCHRVLEWSPEKPQLPRISM